MAYRLYQTEGVILAARGRGESSLLLEILTAELGLVTVVAQGARKATSKLRGHLNCGGVAQVGLVRGREFWRLVAAERGENFSTGELLGKFSAWMRVLALVRRLVAGEGHLPTALLSDLLAGRDFLRAGQFSATELDHYALLAGARILAHLGHLELARGAGDFLNWRPEKLVLSSEARRNLLAQVKQALHTSQL